MTISTMSLSRVLAQMAIYSIWPMILKAWADLAFKVI
jgi:hypothetical protein